MPDDARSDLSARGFVPRKRDAEADVALREAEALIRLAPDLWPVVSARTAGLALISSAGPDYDRSHSEQRWPGWIFVSLPPAGPSQTLRLAEQVVHEAMHFNLAALEAEIPLTRDGRRLFSPWKREERDPSGLLHGLYVFATLSTWFRRLSRHPRLESDARRRMAEIAEEIQEVDPNLTEWLTPPGAILASSLLAEAGQPER